MARPHFIAPSILSADFARLGDEVDAGEAGFSRDAITASRAAERLDRDVQAVTRHQGWCELKGSA